MKKCPITSLLLVCFLCISSDQELQDSEELETLRTPSGNDFNNNNFDFVIAPIIGKSLGGGFNPTSVAEFPTKKEAIDDRGLLISFGITKTYNPCENYF